MSGAIGSNSQQKIGFHFESANASLKIDGKKVNLADAKTITIDDKAGGKKEIQGFIAQDGTIFQVKQGDKAKNGGVDIIVRGTPEQLASYDFGVKNGSVTSARYGENSYRPGVDVTPSDFTIQSGTSGEEILEAHGLVEKQPKVSKDPKAPVINKNNSAASGRDHTKTDTKKLQQETSDAIKANRDQMQKMMEDLELPMRERESAPSSSSTSKPSAPAPGASDAEKKALSPWEAFTKDVETAREELASALSSIENHDGKGAELKSRLDRLESGDFLARLGDNESPVKKLQIATEEVRQIRQEIQDLLADDVEVTRLDDDNYWSASESTNEAAHAFFEPSNNLRARAAKAEASVSQGNVDLNPVINEEASTAGDSRRYATDLSDTNLDTSLFQEIQPEEDDDLKLLEQLEAEKNARLEFAPSREQSMLEVEFEASGRPITIENLKLIDRQFDKYFKELPEDSKTKIIAEFEKDGQQALRSLLQTEDPKRILADNNLEVFLDLLSKDNPIAEENSNQGIQGFQNVTYRDFPTDDNPLGKQNFDYWQKAPNKPDQVKDFVHVPVQGDGFCLVTALAAATNRTTSELIKYLDEVARGSNDKTLQENWKTEKKNAFDGQGIDSNQIGSLLHEAGLGFTQVESGDDQFITSDVGGNLTGPNLIDTNPNAPVLLYRNEHYDVLVRRDVALSLNLPIVGNQYIANDAFQS